MLVTCGPPSILDSAGRCRVHSASAWHNNEGRGCSNSTLEGLWRVSSHFRTCTVRPLSLCWRRHIRVPGEFVQQPTPRLQKLLNLPLTTTAYYRRTWLSLSKMVSLPAATLFLSRLIQQLAATNQTHSKNKAYPRNSPAHLFTMVLVCSFLKMVASGPDAHVINFSDRFTLTDMAGAFSSNLEDGIGLLSEGHGQQELRRRQAAGAYTIPYQLQTGPTRYAPMAKKPGSTIPADKSPTPQFPTSAYEIATAYLSAPTIQTTVSASLTYSVSSIEITVCIARLDPLGRHSSN